VRHRRRDREPEVFVGATALADFTGEELADPAQRAAQHALAQDVIARARHLRLSTDWLTSSRGEGARHVRQP
jgi:hypothetical protein